MGEAFRVRKGTITLSRRMEEIGKRTSGFDYLRLGLSIGVIGFHTFETSYGTAGNAAILAGPWGPAILMTLPGFFAMSGFLVTRSLLHTPNLGTFLALRAIRIFPPLCMALLLCAFLLGPIFTVFPLADYFSDGQFFTYISNIAGIMQYGLPGVFLDNPNPRLVNIQFWTIPFELQAYIALAVLALLGLTRNRLAFLAVVMVLQISCVYHAASYAPADEYHLYRGPLLVFCFLCGVLLYLYRDIVPWSFGLFLAALVFALGAHHISPLGIYFTPLPAAYTTVWLGLCNPERNILTRWSNYSYGLYLYGYQVQQCVMASTSPHFHEWYWNLLFTLPMAGALAALSWHWVEKPAQGLKKYFVHASSRPPKIEGPVACSISSRA